MANSREHLKLEQGFPRCPPESVLLLLRPHVAGSAVRQRGGDHLRMRPTAAALRIRGRSLRGHLEAVRDLDLGRDVVPHELLHVVRRDEGRIALQKFGLNIECAERSEVA